MNVLPFKKCVVALAAVAASLGAGAALAGEVTGVSVTPDHGPITTTFTVHVNGTGSCAGSIWIYKQGGGWGARIGAGSWSAGTFSKTVQFDSSLPKWEHGEYTVGASCSGNNIKTEKTTTFKVDREKIAFPEIYCPDNWMVVAGTVTANGAYTCEPKPIKSAPKVCADKHVWFDEGKLIGCRQVIY